MANVKGFFLQTNKRPADKQTENGQAKNYMPPIHRGGGIK